MASCGRSLGRPSRTPYSYVHFERMFTSVRLDVKERKKVKRVGHSFRNLVNCSFGCCTAASDGRLTEPTGCDVDPHPYGLEVPGCRQKERTWLIRRLTGRPWSR